MKATHTVSEPILSAAGAFERAVADIAARLLLVLPGHPFLESTALHATPLNARAESMPPGHRGDGESVDHPASPLERIGMAYELSAFELELLVLAILPELDFRFADIFAEFQAPQHLRRPTLATAMRVLRPGDEDGLVAHTHFAHTHLVYSHLWQGRLLLRDDPRLPFFDQVLCPTRTLVECLQGRVPMELEGDIPIIRVEPRTQTETKLAMRLRPSVRLASRTLGGWFRESLHGVAHLHGGSREAARLIVSAVTAQQDLDLLQVRDVPPDSGDILRLAELCSIAHGAAVSLELGDGVDAAVLPERLYTPHPVFIHTSERFRLTMPGKLRSFTFSVPLPRATEQENVWRHYLGGAAAEVKLPLLANQRQLTDGDIAGIVGRATHHAQVAGRAAPAHIDVATALRELRPLESPQLAHLRTPRVPWDFLVLDARPQGLIDDLVRRVELRMIVQERWRLRDPGGRGQGVLALLHGEPGVGKSLCVDALASRLELPLLSVDLSRVVSKYIGETEKHLSTLFDAAEGFGALLFFDEADALFGRRTEVRDSHDRYANIETSYLLHRLDTFEGIAILATNLLENMDDAFSRRLQSMIHFSHPTPAQQRSIWERHLPKGRLEPDLDLERIVQQYDLVGGDIRNAALTAAYAAADDAGIITQMILEQAIRQELVKNGRSAPTLGGNSP